ncbi:TRAP transporter small permease subunit [Algibacter sp. 2305UL17-15]|uniref:TRAP transporter small permease n=1 Tax=Algibacter sp. 2305UL17-15 TaxID=3231268 RepID=UPI00345837A7
MLKKHIEKILKLGTIWSVFLLIGSVLLQIFARFFLAQAPSWTEEVSRLCFIFSVAFASPLALKSNYYIHLDVFFNMFSNIWKRRINTLILICVFILFFVLAFASIKFVVMGFTENSPSMGIKMGIAFSSMLILGITMCYFIGLKLIKHLKKPQP